MQELICNCVLKSIHNHCTYFLTNVSHGSQSTMPLYMEASYLVV